MSTPLVHQNTIISPVVTEKSYALSALDKYVFRVAPDASKSQIKKAIKDLYKVDVLSINTIKKGARTEKSHRTGRHVTSSVEKKAIVKIKAGQKIEIFSALKS
ncbi:MAG TPA: 50S ribosomal protein L23 [Candidatus Woesebacteria bacterium]|nr:50S ribosomal protein L23 [Candidatus Woesebacteria bacterium]